VNLLSALGIDLHSYDKFVAWCLAEELVAELTRALKDDPLHQERPLWQRENGFLLFRARVRTVTRRLDWSTEDLEALYERVQLASMKHFREPIRAAEMLRVLWNLPHQCALCQRAPPEVILHVDHIFPSSKGGTSMAENLRFLCAEHNLAKSDHLEEGDLWLNSL
jgi:5-methylcytosine-specific restriction endonuclease McrA